MLRASGVSACRVAGCWIGYRVKDSGVLNSGVVREVWAEAWPIVEGSGVLWSGQFGMLPTSLLNDDLPTLTLLLQIFTVVQWEPSSVAAAGKSPNPFLT